MNRQEKEQLVAQLNENLKSSSASFLVSVQGMPVSDIQRLKRKLHESNSKFKVAKVRLIKLAAKDVPGAQNFDSYLKNQLAIVFAGGEPTSTAKILYDFSKDTVMNLVAGCFESKLLEKNQVEFMATLPPKEMLLAQLVCVLNSPLAGLVSVLNNVLVKPVLVLKQISNKKN